jgi:hypothetical protein
MRMIASVAVKAFCGAGELRHGLRHLSLLLVISADRHLT